MGSYNYLHNKTMCRRGSIHVFVVLSFDLICTPYFNIIHVFKHATNLHLFCFMLVTCQYNIYLTEPSAMHEAGLVYLVDLISTFHLDIYIYPLLQYLACPHIYWKCIILNNSCLKRGSTFVKKLMMRHKVHLQMR